MSLDAHQNDMMWQQHIYGLLEIGVSDKAARSMIGWARNKRKASYREVERAICEMKRKAPPDPAKPWPYWRTALSRSGSKRVKPERFAVLRAMLEGE